LPNYTITGPFTNGGAPGISASFLNNVENALRIPSGGTLSGQYALAGPAYANGAVVATYVDAPSGGTTPVSVTVDTSLLAPSGGMSGSMSTNFLSAYGFQIYTLNTTTNVNNRCAGAWTIQY
jgi:hypothetical protein